MSDEFERPIDEILREARERGEFDNLPGKGKPIQWEDESLVPEDLRLANRLMRNNGFTLDWIQAGKDIDQEYADIQKTLQNARAELAAGRLDNAGWEIESREYARRIRKLNQQIIGYNLRVPNEQLHKRAYRLDIDIQDES